MGGDILVLEKAPRVKEGAKERKGIREGNSHSKEGIKLIRIGGQPMREDQTKGGGEEGII